MIGYNDYSVAFAWSLILKTLLPWRAARKGPGATALEQCAREVTVRPEQCSHFGCARGRRRSLAPGSYSISRLTVTVAQASRL